MIDAGNTGAQRGSTGWGKAKTLSEAKSSPARRGSASGTLNRRQRRHRAGQIR